MCEITDAIDPLIRGTDDRKELCEHVILVSPDSPVIVSGNVLTTAVERWHMAGIGVRSIEGVSIDGIRDTLARSELVFAVLFGSYARGTVDESSDVDITLRFPDEMGARERFRLRNRLDAELQQYAEDFVDVSDIDALPTSVAHTALREGDLLVGDESTVEAYRKRIFKEYEATADERERKRRDLIERLAAGNV